MSWYELTAPLVSPCRGTFEARNCWLVPTAVSAWAGLFFACLWRRSSWLDWLLNAPQSSGFEDFYLSGQYFDAGEFATSLSGITTENHQLYPNNIAAYRLLEADPVVSRCHVVRFSRRYRWTVLSSSAFALIRGYSLPLLVCRSPPRAALDFVLVRFTTVLCCCNGKTDGRPQTQSVSPATQRWNHLSLPTPHVEA